MIGGKAHWPESAEAGSVRNMSELQSFWLPCLFVVGSFLLRSSCWINEFRVPGQRRRGDVQHVRAHQAERPKGLNAVSPSREAGHVRPSVGHGRLGLPANNYYRSIMIASGCKLTGSGWSAHDSDARDAFNQRLCDIGCSLCS